MNCYDCKNTGKQICTVCCTYQGGVPDRWEPKPATNADRIRAMTDEELAEWLAEVLFHCSNTICDERCPMYKCCCDQSGDNIEDWLKQEVTND